MPAATFTDLPRAFSGVDHFLYAVEFAGGLVKVGVTGSPRMRVQTLQSRLRRRVRRYAVHALPDGLPPYSAEAHALRTCAALATDSLGHEMFAGLRFCEAVMAIRHAERRAHAIPLNRSGGSRRCAPAEAA